MVKNEEKNGGGVSLCARTSATLERDVEVLDPEPYTMGVVDGYRVGTTRPLRAPLSRQPQSPRAAQALGASAAKTSSLALRTSFVFTRATASVAQRARG